MAEETKIEWTNKTLPDGTVVPGATFNGWIGCEKVSPACKNCYAERDFDLRKGRVKWGGLEAGGTRSITKTWDDPVKWARDAHAAGWRRFVFAYSLADIFEDWRGPIVDSKGKTMFAPPGCVDDPSRWEGHYAIPNDAQGWTPITVQILRQRQWRLMAETSYALDWLVLTKRPEVAVREWASLQMLWLEELWACTGKPDGRKYDKVHRYVGERAMMPNVFFGITAESQEWLEKRWVHARMIPTPVIFLSCEPLRGPINPRHVRRPGTDLVDDILTGETISLATGCIVEDHGPHAGWVISGGESGDGARPEHPDWHRSLRDAATHEGIPYHFKQFGEWLPLDHAGPEHRGSQETNIYATDKQDHAALDVREGRAPLPMLSLRVGKKKAGRTLDGREWSEYPTPPLED